MTQADLLWLALAVACALPLTGALLAFGAYVGGVIVANGLFVQRARPYPRLVEALREIADGRELPMHEARALLRELGEDA